jgi:hypothetical protein
MLTAKSHTFVTPSGDYTYSKESNLCYSSRWLYLQQRVTPLLLLHVIILTAKSHTFVTPPCDYTYSKESNLCYCSMWIYVQQRVTPLLLLQVIIITAEWNLCYSSRWIYLQQNVTPLLLLQLIILIARIVSDMLSTQNLKGWDDICWHPASYEGQLDWYLTSL